MRKADRPLQLQIPVDTEHTSLPSLRPIPYQETFKYTVQLKGEYLSFEQSV